jgi:predicted secreted hydrolase
LGSYGFGATSEDKISSLYAFNSVKDYPYDLTFEAKSKVLLNGGNGVITFGQGYTNSTEWAIPALKTNGTFSVGEGKFQVDAAKSFTWYDRQAGNGAPQSWAWFQLHFPGTAIKASIWAYDLAAPAGPTENRFATIRFGEEAHLVLPYTLIASTTNVWKSDHTNVTYPLSWTLNFENGDKLEDNSVRGDQEIYGGREQIGNSVYAGFIEAKGKFLGQHAGFGVVEMIQLR